MTMTGARQRVCNATHETKASTQGHCYLYGGCEQGEGLFAPLHEVAGDVPEPSVAHHISVQGEQLQENNRGGGG